MFPYLIVSELPEGIEELPQNPVQWHPPASRAQLWLARWNDKLLIGQSNRRYQTNTMFGLGPGLIRDFVASISLVISGSEDTQKQLTHSSIGYDNETN